ncbi:MAG: metallophosphoesterase [Pseudomonadota bacterium]
MSTRFIHTADWQLGMTRHFLSGDAQARFTQARFDAVRAIGELAASHEAQFVVVAGDVFESNQLQRTTVANAVDAINAIPVPVALLPGNHDPLDASAVFDSAAFTSRIGDHVHVLRDSQPVSIAPGVEVVGAPWYSKRPLQDLVRSSLEPLSRNEHGVRITVAHGAVDSLTPDVANPALIDVARAAAAIDAGVVQYIALGDRHSVTEVGAGGRIWYSGSPEPTDYTEQKPGYVLLVDVDDDGTTNVTELQTGQWRFVRPERFILNGEADIDRLASFIDALENKSRTVLKLDLVGTLPLRLRGRFDDVLEHARDLLAALELGTRLADLVFMPDEVDAGALQLSGFASRAFEQLSEQADQGGDEDAARAARDALALLYRLSGPSSP